MNISNNIASLQAHQTMLNTSANNVANTNSDGFVPTQTRVIGDENSIRAQNTQADNTGSQTSQTDLSKEMVTQMVAEDVSAINVATIRTQDEMFGTLLDIKA
ncbi:MAG: hypothetical protein PHX44_09730 [Sulfurimonas sp.]|uniref:hypothetical protein n=1 Tax=Sulfurimonas sp. TaxID=2022749 RepID=UPI002634EBB1|nr:hypothetical protein [Sulfurimonas sp.]MDD2653314.1 hypothetical protein [Sulfurimonas sp.]MDD3450709.1 hypothetical protein [Sulfurimonas sp.]